ncbi:MAG: alkyl hydroperoxide reductase [Massilia sp.]|jgi:thiol-disulfide isomerase/thioredoxin|nr:alkyl hydroperoxide reductase [Massilia sp.]
MNKKKLAVVGAVALIFGGLGAVFGTHRNTPNAAAPLTGEPGAPATAASSTDGAPAGSPVAALYAQSLNDAAGKPQSLSQWKGKPLVVNFWAPWCAPCVKEMPELAALAADSAAKNINVIGIGIDSPTNIAEFATKVKVSYPLYVAGMSGTELSRGFGNTSGSLPYTVLIGADGKVKKTYLGQLKFDQLKADMAAL